MAAGGAPRQGILSLTIKDKAALYAAYMPFVGNGGLFIPTSKSYNLGEEVFMLLTLMDDSERLPVAGKIIWITPAGAQGNKAAGIGVQFGPQDNGQTRAKIETYLA
ncbi:Type IV pilus biogenesis protein PilZ, partial [hydrothermal vent metagenome]